MESKYLLRELVGDEGKPPGKGRWETLNSGDRRQLAAARLVSIPNLIRPYMILRHAKFQVHGWQSPFFSCSGSWWLCGISDPLHSSAPSSGNH